MMMRRCSRALEGCKKLSSEYLVRSLQARGTNAFFGMPDYYLRPFTSYLADHTAAGEYVIATNCSNAMEIAAGYYLSSQRPPCVFMHGNGVADALDPLLALFTEDAFRIPCLMLISSRGTNGSSDEQPKSGLVSPVLQTERCLAAVGIPSSIVGSSLDIKEKWDITMEKAYHHMASAQTPFAVLLESDTLMPYEQRRPDTDTIPTAPLDVDTVANQVCRQFNTTDVFVCSCGSVQESMRRARRAASSDAAPQDFFLANCLGHATGVATGIALSRPSLQVVCIEGDGAALAHLNAMATSGGLHAVKDAITGAGLLRNFKHIVINDGFYSLEGGHATASFDTSLTDVARACGYCEVRKEPVIELGDLVAALAELRQCDGPAFLEAVVSKASSSHDTARRDLQAERHHFTEFLKQVGV